jgi:uncharacterized phage protein (TIGR02218 family)
VKQASSALQSFLASARGQLDMVIAFADCFTFTLTSGAVLTYTNADVPVTYQGKQFLANGPLVDGLKYRGSVGLNVDRQEVTIAAKPGDYAVAGAMFIASLGAGLFDGAQVQRDRVFFSDVIGGTLVDGVTLFFGRVSTGDEIGRTKGKITVANELVLLDLPMPRNIYAPMCLHVLYDTGCGLAAATFGTTGAVAGGSTQTLINFAGAVAQHAQGKLIFQTGANAGLSFTVKSVVAGTSLTLAYQTPFTPAAGDGFAVYYGCDHTQSTCQSRFNNLASFKGFPFVPPPQYAISGG